MRYRSGTAFRQALTHQIRQRARATGSDPQWLWKVVAFDRLLARLVEVTPTAWVLKGGFALDLRLGDRARTTQDVDLAWLADEGTADTTLLRGALHDLRDFSRFG